MIRSGTHARMHILYCGICYGRNVKIFRIFSYALLRTLPQGSIRHRGEGLLNLRVNVYLTLALKLTIYSKTAKYRHSAAI